MDIHEFVIATNALALVSSVFAVGIIFLHRSAALNSNKRRTAAGASYKAFLELLAKTGIINLVILAVDAVWTLDGTALKFAYGVTCVYLGMVIIAMLLFVSVGDFLSKILLWYHSNSGRAN